MSNEIKSGMLLEPAVERSIVIADANAIRMSIDSILAMAEEMQIESANDVAVVEGILTKCRDARERVESFLGPHIKRAFEQHRSLTADKRKFTDKIDKAERILKPKLADFLYREDQRKLAEARERERIRVRVEAKAGETADEAHRLVKAGEHEKAAEVVNAGYAEVERLENSVPDSPAVMAESHSVRTHWDFEITDPSKVPAKFLMPDEKKIRKIVEALKDQFDAPGIRAFPVRTVVSKAVKR